MNKAKKDTNASTIERGFHYQDMVGLIEFLDNIEQATAVNVEGKDDIDLYFEDGQKYYYQAKETVNPYSKNMSQEFGKALTTLNEDIKDERTNKLIYVSNSTQPLGDAKGSVQFMPSYAFYSYKQLEPRLQEKIQKLLDKRKDLSNIGKNIDKLYIMKISYEGADDQTKFRELNDRVERFTEKIKLVGYKRELTNEWQQMITRSTEEEKKTVKKEEFYSHTMVTIMYSNKTSSKDFYDFLETFDVAYDNEVYIKEQYEELVDKLYSDFDKVNIICEAYLNFLRTNADLKRSQRFEKFVNEYTPVLKKDMGIKSKKDDDVVKFLIWITIKSQGCAEDIKDVINYEID